MRISTSWRLLLKVFDAKFLFDFSLYLQNDVNLRIYEKLKYAEDYTRQERETLVYETLILLKEEPPDKSLKSSIPRHYVKENVSFVVDTNKLKSVNDILADDTRTWLNNGAAEVSLQEGWREE